jgi:hypothetical protein
LANLRSEVTGSTYARTSSKICWTDLEAACYRASRFEASALPRVPRGRDQQARRLRRATSRSTYA